ncbi:hypothetical protein GLE_3214 [Lysobacter enzymogenes]|uniref:Uncharacterized protein n=1 Tax=Lysobacter enzymogenes TaxID=69 RepID=A0A0S2DJ77_LYSEN|nr:hypothetical protein GLE_3214 [Lysobacter enzymogenes]
MSGGFAGGRLLAGVRHGRFLGDASTRERGGPCDRVVGSS